MSIVRVIEGEQAMEGPGIFLNTQDRSRFALKPVMDNDGIERVPYSWATDFPPLGDFLLRFPAHWKLNGREECWVGEAYNPGGVYFCQYNPFDQRSGR
jgi:hypothetical protein